MIGEEQYSKTAFLVQSSEPLIKFSMVANNFEKVQSTSSDKKSTSVEDESPSTTQLADKSKKIKKHFK